MQAQAQKEEKAKIDDARKNAAAVARDEVKLKHDQEQIVLQILAMNKDPTVPVQQA